MKLGTFSLLTFVWSTVCAKSKTDTTIVEDLDTFSSDEEKLFTHLLRRYNNRIRPVRSWNESVNVALTFSLKQIHHLDEKVQVFKTYGWLIVIYDTTFTRPYDQELVNEMQADEWKDERLSWPIHRFNNMTQFVVDSPLIWTPELALINAVDNQFPDFSKYRAIVSSTGMVRWEPAGVFETSCIIDITFYPYDTQSVNLDDYNISGEWNILGTCLERHQFSYDCCPYISFSKIAATINLIRRHRFFTLNLILPCAMLSSLTLVTFMSPPDQGEKISLGISILLSFSVFMLSMSENMPKTSETLPLFGSRHPRHCHCLVGLCSMNTWSVMLTVLVLNLHHRNECRPIPGWLRLLAFEGLARLLCMYTEQHVIVYQHRIQQRRKSSAALLAGCQPGGGAGGGAGGPGGGDGGGGSGAGSGGASYVNRGPRHSLHQINEYWKQAEQSMAHKRRYIPANHSRHNNHDKSTPAPDVGLKERCSGDDQPQSLPPLLGHHHGNNFCSPSVAKQSINSSPGSSPKYHKSNCIDTFRGESTGADTSTTGNRPAVKAIDSHISRALSAATCSGLLAAATTTSDRLLTSGGPLTQRRVVDGLRVTFIDEDAIRAKQAVNRWRRSPAAATLDAAAATTTNNRKTSSESSTVSNEDEELGSHDNDSEPEMVEPDEVLVNLELQEWKRLARIMDRLFFWMTLTALISVSLVLACLLIWR